MGTTDAEIDLDHLDLGTAEVDLYDDVDSPKWAGVRHDRAVTRVQGWQAHTYSNWRKPALAEAVPVARVQFGVGPYELLQEIDQHNEQAAECPYGPYGLPDIDQPELGWLMVKTNALGVVLEHPQGLMLPAVLPARSAQKPMPGPAPGSAPPKLKPATTTWGALTGLSGPAGRSGRRRCPVRPHCGPGSRLAPGLSLHFRQRFH